jgi:N-methylhydantoinase A/oxoprolinase/acetone carboxylase beta subunit
MTASMAEPAIEIPSFAHASRGSTATSSRVFRRIYDEGRGEFIAAAVIRGDEMRARQEIPGPAIVEREDTTIHILDGQTGCPDERGCLLIRSDRVSP